MDDETFIKERDVLQAKIIKLQMELRDTESRAEKWLELTERTFNFACYAHKKFITECRFCTTYSLLGRLQGIEP